PFSTENETSWRATTPPNGRVTFSSSSSANALGPALDEVEQSPEDAGAVRTQAVVLELVRHPRAETPNRGSGLLRELARNVHVLGVDRRRGRNVVLGQAVAVVEPWPLVLSEELRGLRQRLERPVLLKHPWVDVLAGEKGRIVSQLGREDAFRRPPGRRAVRVAGLVHDRVQRVPRERLGGPDVVQERGRAEWELEDVVETLGAVAHPEHVPDLAETPRRQRVAAW